MARERRTRKEVVIAKIAALDEKAAVYAEKIAELNAQKEELQEELDAMADAERKAAEEAQVKEVLKLLKEQNVSLDELKHLVENR